MRAPLLAFVLLVACKPPPLVDPDTAPGETGGGTTDPPYDPSAGEALYDDTVLHRVSIEMDPDDWDALRQQQRNLLAMLTGDCLEEPFDSPYTWFEADVTVDGVAYQDVGVRKKGLLGSESSEKPSLKIHLDKYVDGALFDGLDRLTLNNGRQDPAVISQCLGYGLFRAAGLPASRCSFATVELNGVPLGVYSNLEPMEPPLLARWYDDPEGRLWEGQLSDFREGWTGTFEPQEGDGDPAALDAVTDALAQPDDQVLAALDGAIDLDRYYGFWAMEVLLGHWDGYAGNSNNFFVYQDPADGRLDFMPWGIDALFDADEPFGSTRPTSVVAVTALPRRLYLHPDGQAAYLARLRGLLDEVWDEDAIGARIDAMEAQVLPEADPDGGAGVAAAVDEIRGYVRGRRAHIEAELAGGPPSWSEQLRGNPCLVDVGEVPLTFETTWGSYGTQDWASYGSGTMGFTYNGVLYDVELLGVLAGEMHGDGTLLALGRLDWGSLLAVLMTFPTTRLADGASFTMDWSEGQAYLYYDESGTGQGFAVAAYLGDGPVVFDEADDAWGATLRGSAMLQVFGGQ